MASGGSGDIEAFKTQRLSTGARERLIQHFDEERLRAKKAKRLALKVLGGGVLLATATGIGMSLQKSDSKLPVPDKQAAPETAPDQTTPTEGVDSHVQEEIQRIKAADKKAQEKGSAR